MVRENLLISSSILLGLGTFSGTTTVNSRTITLLFPSLVTRQKTTIVPGNKGQYAKCGPPLSDENCSGMSQIR